MTNPVVVQMLSKAANQERARQVAEIQLMNQAEKVRSNNAGILRSLVSALSGLIGRLSPNRTSKLESRAAKFVAEQK